MRSWTGIPELKEAHRQLGARRFWSFMTLLVTGIVTWAAVGMWLKTKIGWPEKYGFRCHGRGCWIDDMWHSPSLLAHLGVYEIGLFAWIWSMPALIIAAVIYAKLKKRRDRTFL